MRFALLISLVNPSPEDKGFDLQFSKGEITSEEEALEFGRDYVEKHNDAANVANCKHWVLRGAVLMFRDFPDACTEWESIGLVPESHGMHERMKCVYCGAQASRYPLSKSDPTKIFPDTYGKCKALR